MAYHKYASDTCHLRQPHIHWVWEYICRGGEGEERYWCIIHDTCTIKPHTQHRIHTAHTHTHMVHYTHTHIYNMTHTHTRALLHAGTYAHMLVLGDTIDTRRREVATYPSRIVCGRFAADCYLLCRISQINVAAGLQKKVSYL